MNTQKYIEIAVLLAGIGQLVLVLASFAIPHCLGWKGELAKLPKLLRQIYWTYAAYMLCMHFFFGMISTFGTELLLDATPLATILSGLMATWWSVRIVLQFCCFDRKGIPPTRFNTIAEVILISFFIYLALTYSCAFYLNLTAG